MSPIQLAVLAGVLILIMALELKILIKYLERKEAKQKLQHYTETIKHKINVPFTFDELKSSEEIKDNLEANLDLLKSQEIEKIGIIHNDELVAVILPIERYENLLEYVFQIKDTATEKTKA